MSQHGDQHARAGFDPAGKVVAVTGAGSGIGEALARNLATRAPAAIAVVDLDEDAAAATAARLGGLGHAFVADLGTEDGVTGVLGRIGDELGPIDLWCSNAGIFTFGGVELPTEAWDRIWAVNVMSHVWAAKVLVPDMVARGGGWFMITASAAGLLSQIGSAPYSVTKHGAVAFGEWLAITHGDDGLGVTLLCPQAVATAMTAGVPGGGPAGLDGMLGADEVAEAAVAGMEAGTFLVLPHPEVATYEQRRAGDRDRWLAGMRRVQAMFSGRGEAGR
jgi:NAD(P)-dependent dehydrogenase (short-subunit alcohol dehydrogenase family)